MKQDELVKQDIEMVCINIISTFKLFELYTALFDSQRIYPLKLKYITVVFFEKVSESIKKRCDCLFNTVDVMANLIFYFDYGVK